MHKAPTDLQFIPGLNCWATKDDSKIQ